MPRVLILVALSIALLLAHAGADLESATDDALRQRGSIPNPILFVTQVPIPADFATIGSVFANHSGEISRSGRGGDLYIRYPDGTLRNLTLEAGFGNDGFQGDEAIAVRDPAVHWSGDKAVFSMVVGAPPQFQHLAFYWQLYEVTGLGQGQLAQITKVPNQPTDYNNVSPIYGTDDRILFTSDRPRNGARHLYPQHDEYESTETVTGLWSLDPADGDLKLLEHAPSGSFKPSIDSFGRVIFTRWDHLQRDQQADGDALGGNFGTFDFADESAGAARLPRAEEIFPEPRPARTDLLAGTNLFGHRINHFFPWTVEEDGRGEETLAHVGRHELHSYFQASLNDDPNLVEFIAGGSGRTNPYSILNVLQLHEDPSQPGRYLAVEAPEFQTHAAGQVIALTAPPGVNPDSMTVESVTHPETGTVVPDGVAVPPEHSGHYRNPLPLSDGGLWSVHTFEARAAANEGTRAQPVPRYRFRIRELVADATGHLSAGPALTGGIQKTVSYFDPDVLVQYTGELWELDPVEVRPRPRPQRSVPLVTAPELQVFVEEGISPRALSRDLQQRQLGLMVSRDVTTRDQGDRQQPFNLRVPGGVETIGAAGRIYDVDHMQIFQADQLRGIGGISNPDPGRRVLARPLHDPAAVAANPPLPGAAPGSVAVALDGSVAAFVPARRALAWQINDPAWTPVVRERYWITVQPGEIRTCDGCHGINTANQEGNGAAQNPPEALRSLLRHWKQQTGMLFSDGFESGDLAAWAP